MKPEEEYKEEITRFAKSDPCPYCGKTFKPRGLGTHIREAHGMKIKTVVRTVVKDSSTVVKDYSTVVPDSSTTVNDYSTVVQRPSDYVKKRSKVIKTIEDPVIARCEDCGKRDKVERLTHIGLKKETSLLCYDCWNKRYLR